MTTKTAEKKTEFTSNDIFALWKKTSKNGNTYFTGKSKEGLNLRGFFNTNKKNPKEPDLRVYITDNGGLAKEPIISMWCNVSKNGNKFLTGKLGDDKVVAFIRKSDNEKAPYLTAYLSSAIQQKIDMPVEEPKEPEKAKEPF